MGQAMQGINRKNLIEQLKYIEDQMWDKNFYEYYPVVRDAGFLLRFDEQTIQQLKEESVEKRTPVKPRKFHGFWFCGNRECDMLIFEGDAFCRGCGKPVVWEGASDV